MAEFLSGRYWPTKFGYRFGKKPGRVLAKIGYLLAKQGRKPADYQRSFKGTLVSYLPTANHVPFLRVYIHECLAFMTGIQADYSGTRYRVKGGVCQADDETWAAFEELYGLNRDDERLFAVKVRDHLRGGRFGFLDSWEVEVMHHIDFLLE
jgi:hypothetical protein